MIVAIDPSIHHVGMACYFPASRNILTTTIEIPKCPTGAPQLQYMLACLRLRLKIHAPNPDTVICEYPTFQRSERGAIAATQGHTFGLAATCGYLCSHYYGTPVLLPTPRQWKGTVPKHVTGQRFTKWTGKDYRELKDHEVDAAMMIQWSLANTKPATWAAL